MLRLESSDAGILDEEPVAKKVRVIADIIGFNPILTSASADWTFLQTRRSCLPDQRTLTQLSHHNGTNEPFELPGSRKNMAKITFRM